MPTNNPDRTDPALDASTSNPEGQENGPSVSRAPEAAPRGAARSPSTGEPRKRGAKNASPAHRTYMGAGILFVVLGLALAIGPRISPQVAEALKPLGNLGVYAGGLIAAGMVLLGFGILQRMFSDIRDTVNRVGSESQRIKNFASVTEKATASRGTVISKVNQLDAYLKEQQENARAILREGFAKAAEAAAQRDDGIDGSLQAFTERFGKEMERRQEDLSASLGKRFAGLEARLDRVDNEHAAGLEQLGDQLWQRLSVSWNQRCDSLEESFTDMAETAHASSGAVTSALTSQVNQLDALLKEQHESTRVSMEAVFAKVDEASLQASDRIEQDVRAMEERLGGELERRQEALFGGLEGLSDDTRKTAQDAAAGREELGKNLARQIEGQSVALAERLAGFEARLDRQDYEHAAGLEQLGDQLGERLDISLNERCDSLEERITGLTEKAHASSGNVISRVNQLDAFLKEEHKSWHASLEAGFAKVDEASLQTGGCIDQGLQAMEERLGEEMERRQEALFDGLEGVSDGAQRAVRDTAAGLEGLGKNLNRQIEGQLVSLAEKFANLEARLDRLDHEHSSGLEQLGERLGRELADGSEALLASLKAATEAELASGLERHDRLEELVLEQLCDFESLLRETAQVPSGTASESQENLNQDGAQIEQELDIHTDTLAGELMAVDESEEEALGTLEEPDAEWSSTGDEWAPIEEQENEPGSLYSTDEAPDESHGEESEILFCSEPKAPFGMRKSKEPAPFGQNVDWDWSGLEDDTDQGDDLSSEIPPALPGVPEDAQDPTLVKQPAGDSEHPVNEGSDAPHAWPDTLHDPDSDDGSPPLAG